MPVPSSWAGCVSGEEQPAQGWVLQQALGCLSSWGTPWTPSSSHQEARDGGSLQGRDARLRATKAREVEGGARALRAGLGRAGRVGAGKQGQNHRAKGSVCGGTSSWEVARAARDRCLLWLCKSRWATGITQTTVASCRAGGGGGLKLLHGATRGSSCSQKPEK